MNSKQVVALTKQVRELERENKTLTRDLNYANSRRQALAACLREARETSRQLWENLQARSREGN